MTESRAWCFTLNNYTEEEDNALQALECVYLIYGYEVAPETGTPHLQGYVRFKSAKKLEQVKAKIPRAHLEKARGSCEDNVAYCKKTREGDTPNEKVFEKGDRPLSPKEKGVCEKRRWQEILQHAKDGDEEWFAENEPQVAYKYAKTNDYLATKYAKRPADLTERCVHHFFYGVPKSGKSHDARYNKDKSNTEFYEKDLNKWWPGYQGQDRVVIDELEPTHVQFLSAYLKKWADVYPFHAETKGGSKLIRPKVIYITSNYSMQELFGHDPALLDAMRTRFIVTHYPFPYNSAN